jgi:hypothetical protein
MRERMRKQAPNCEAKRAARSGKGCGAREATEMRRFAPEERGMANAIVCARAGQKAREGGCVRGGSDWQ